MKTRHITLLALVLAAGAGPALAADIANGKQLQQENCRSCHDDGMYTRENRKVTTPDGLMKQVRRCESTLGLQWFDEDINDVAAYLNESFYKFR